ncbi:hypothetical protein CSV72_01990 [Sporosarcina sp. P20a]|nr:thermonuclease family protein [Sporosarcina sp. P20a]PIC87942.1 hypothetical protein CSV72_01990 [Sporosarcina sp. P20a]
MQYLLGCLGIIIVLAIIIAIAQWLFSNIIGVIGLLIVAWSAYHWYQNRKLGAKSKMPGILIAIGLLVMITGFSSSSTEETSNEVEQKQETEQVAKENPKETEKGPKEESKAKEKKSETAEKTVPVVVPDNNTTKEDEPAKVDKPTETDGTTARIPVELVKVIDGDTIKIIYDGKEQNVRYLLIDTPETNHPRLGKQPFGEEAKIRNKELIESGKLEIEFDVGERFDKYDRLLAYIYVDGKSVQKILLSEGLARVAYVYPPNTRHLDPYEQSQVVAKEKKLGIWSIENYASDSGFNEQKVVKEKPVTPAPAPKPQPVVPAPPAAKPAAPAQGTEWFQNCTELRKTYPNGVPQGHPAYQSKMDRDKDGFACER